MPSAPHQVSFRRRIFCSARVVVEHTLAGVKRCRNVKDVLRLTKEGISDCVMEIACGLHNLRVSFRKLIQDFKLLSFSVPVKTENVYSCSTATVLYR